MVMANWYCSLNSQCQIAQYVIPQSKFFQRVCLLQCTVRQGEYRTKTQQSVYVNVGQKPATTYTRTVQYH